MTACVNRKHTKKVAAVVTASLVGALSLGAAPVAAVADTGIETLAADWNTGAKLTKATDGKGATVSNPVNPTFQAKSGKYLKPSEVTNSFGDVTKIDDDFSLVYYEYSDATDTYARISMAAEDYFSASGNPTGTFAVEVWDADGNHTDKFAFKISASSQTLEDVHAFVGDPSSTDIYWTGSDLSGDIAFADADGQELDGAVVSGWTDSNGTAVTSITNPGTYVAKISYQGATANVSVTVSALDLTKVAVQHSDVKGAIANVDDVLTNGLKVNGNEYDGSIPYLKVTSVKKSDGTTGFTSTGQYTVTVASSGASYNNFVKGSASFTVNLIDTDVFDTCDVYYGRDPMDATEYVYLADGESFDVSKVKVTNAAGSQSYSGDRLEISFTKGGKAVDASELANPGTYEMTVRVKPQKSFVGNAWTGGTSTVFTIEVLPNSVSSKSDLAFYVDGEIAGNKAEFDYDGTDHLDSISTVVKSGDKTYEEGVDYDVIVKDDATGKEVDSIVNAGSYTITVDPITFKFTAGMPSDLELKVTVNQVTADQLVADVDSMKYDANKTTGEIFNSVPVYDDVTGAVIGSDPNEFYVAYTGSAVEVPGVLVGNIEKDASGNVTKATYTELSSDLYNVVSIKKDGKTVDAAVEEGIYTVEIALNDTAGGNYDLGTNDTFTFTVKKFGHFTDVDATKWYSVPVEKAADLGYVNGISGTNLFAPEADITRADAVCILFNMAGGKSMPDEDFSFDENTGYNTGFSDVDGHAYFAKALAWARAFGVANGYGDGTFAPYAQITREEFASMLANYAKAMGKFTAAADDALDGVSDANTVSDWAEDNVAWAVENGVMGNGGFVAGQSNITRAEVAAMAVNYQPEAL